MKNITKAIMILLFPLVSLAQVGKDELAKESVLPIFDNPISVKNRLIVTANKLELAGFYGMNLTEAIFSTNRLGLNLTYHFSEVRAVNFSYSMYGSGLSSYGNQLLDGYKLDFTRAPAPKYTILVSYEPKFFYGKMSLTKNYNMNLSLYTLLGGGLFAFQNKSYPGLSAGLGQRFYFTPQLSLRFDMRLNTHMAPVPFLENRIKTKDPKPEYSEFQEKVAFDTTLDIGLSYIF